MHIVKARYVQGQIQLPAQDLPSEAEVFVVFPDPKDAAGLSAEQHALTALQAASGFAQTILTDPAEDCWNNA